MHKVLVLACFVASVSLADSKSVDNPKTLDTHRDRNETLVKSFNKDIAFKAPNKVHDSDQLKEVSGTIPVNKNETSLKTIIQKVLSKTRIKQVIHDKSNGSESVEFKVTELKHHSKDESQNTFHVLQKIHARITRSKDAVWAAITLTALCILLLLAVAQSRMWKEHHYSESQGVPLPNFNEKVLFKDVMERKISSLKQFFKKHSKEKKNETELESLLPPSEWDS